MSNEAGVVESNSAFVKVYAPVRFIELPKQVQVFRGGEAVFKCNTGKQSLISYQWLYENQPIIGETERSLIVKNVQDENAGKYRVIATNPAGKVVSPEVRLLTLKRAEITTPPKGDILLQGDLIDGRGCQWNRAA